MSDKDRNEFLAAARRYLFGSQPVAEFDGFRSC